MSKFGLLGKTLSHSLSPFLHGEYFEIENIDGEYELFELGEEELPKGMDYFQREGIKGINVTIPYKENIIELLDFVHEKAEEIGAVNTIRFKDGRREGFNTDYYGVAETFRKNGVTVRNKRVLILGTGGASKAVETCVKDLGAEEVVFISRKAKEHIKGYKIDTYENIDKYNNFEILINTTPVGMMPNREESPLHEKHVVEREFVFDLIYNPFRTKLLQYAHKNSVKNDNGLYMLVVQGMKSQEIWRGIKVEQCVVEEVYRRCLRNERVRRNIVLIGMPGAGKSTVGKKLAGIMELELVECDSLIEKKAEKSIPEIFKEGEEVFRKIEGEIVERVSLMRGKVISTGGGVVKNERNMERLRYNGIIIFLQRDPHKIYKDISACKNRPLVMDEESYFKIYNERKELYHKASDFIVDCNKEVEAVVEDIIRTIQ